MYTAKCFSNDGGSLIGRCHIQHLGEDVKNLNLIYIYIYKYIYVYIYIYIHIYIYILYVGIYSNMFQKTCGFNRICHLLFHGLSFWQAQTEDTSTLCGMCILYNLYKHIGHI